MKKDSPIGFFDSGVGGLSVYARFRELLPSENTIYFGDLKNLPYGGKSQEELVGLATDILDFFKEKSVKAVVIACNTSSALAYEKVKDKYDFKIYPIIQSSAELIGGGAGACRIGVFATVGTVNSHAYSKELLKYNPNIIVKEIACPQWVSIVENQGGSLDDIKIHMEEMLSFNPDKIILGCTHYPYLMETLKQFAPEDKFIDPAKIFVNYIYDDLKSHNLLNSNGGNEEFFVSAFPEKFVKNAKIFYEVKSLPKVVSKSLIL